MVFTRLSEPDWPSYAYVIAIAAQMAADSGRWEDSKQAANEACTFQASGIAEEPLQFEIAMMQLVSSWHLQHEVRICLPGRWSMQGPSCLKRFD